MHLTTRFSPGDRIYFQRDGHYFPALITAMQIDITRNTPHSPAVAVRYCFDVPPYVLAEEDCFGTAAEAAPRLRRKG